MARAGLTAPRVIAAAADLADRVGLDKVTISALAREFGVAEPSMYSHVRGVAELRKGVAVLAAAEFAERIGDAVAGRSGKDALRAFADAYRRYASSFPGRYSATHIQLSQEELSRSDGHQKILATTSALFRGYELHGDALIDAVRFVRSTFHGFVSLEAVGGFGDPRDRRHSWDAIVEALHEVLTTWPRDQRGADPG